MFMRAPPSSRWPARGSGAGWRGRRSTATSPCPAGCRGRRRSRPRTGARSSGAPPPPAAARAARSSALQTASVSTIRSSGEVSPARSGGSANGRSRRRAATPPADHLVDDHPAHVRLRLVGPAHPPPLRVRRGQRGLHRVLGQLVVARDRVRRPEQPVRHGGHERLELSLAIGSHPLPPREGDLPSAPPDASRCPSRFVLRSGGRPAASHSSWAPRIRSTKRPQLVVRHVVERQPHRVGQRRAPVVVRRHVGLRPAVGPEPRDSTQQRRVSTWSPSRRCTTSTRENVPVGRRRQRRVRGLHLGAAPIGQVAHLDPAERTGRRGARRTSRRRRRPSIVDREVAVPVPCRDQRQRVRRALAEPDVRPPPAARVVGRRQPVDDEDEVVEVGAGRGAPRRSTRARAGATRRSRARAARPRARRSGGSSSPRVRSRRPGPATRRGRRPAAGRA